MTPAEIIPASHDLDATAQLPLRNRVSVTAVLIVQALNAFSDNFAKMLLIVFCHAVAKGTRLGDDVQVYLGIIFSLPFVFFAPVAGYFSDRHSKQRVIFWAQVVQAASFAGFLGALMLPDDRWKVVAGTIVLCVLATQETFLAPAKMGILKDLVGSRRLGPASGAQQMSMFAAILAGYAVAGKWFSGQLEAGIDPWHSMRLAMAVVTGVAVLQAIGAAFVQRTTEHHDVPWRTSIWWEHFGSLRSVFKAPAVGLAGLGIVFFWFLCNAVSSILVGVCNETFLVEEVSSEMKGIFSLLLGVGVVLGSLLASFICRKSIQLNIVPGAVFALSVVLFLAMLIPAESKASYLVMTLIGFAAGVFMVPLYGFIQDRSAANERAKILAGVGLIDCLGGTLANVLVLGLLTAHMPSRTQLGLMAAISLGAGFFMLRVRRYRDH